MGSRPRSGLDVGNDMREEGVLVKGEEVKSQAR